VSRIAKSPSERLRRESSSLGALPPNPGDI
jgi:hypothetical protein